MRLDVEGQKPSSKGEQEIRAGITGRPAFLFGNRSEAFGANGISFEKIEIPGNSGEAAVWLSARRVSRLAG